MQEEKKPMMITTNKENTESEKVRKGESKRGGKT